MRNINNIDIEDKYTPSVSFKGFVPQTREELLARDLAEALDDRKGLRLYLAYARRYPESFLRQTLSEVKEIPASRIKKSRAALFNHLVQRYVAKSNNYPGH